LAGGGFMDQIDDLALVVRLAELDRELVAPRGLAAKLLHVLERRAAIGLRLARAEAIGVGPVQDVDGFRHGVSCRRDRGSVPLYRDPARKGEVEARERHDIGPRARRLARAPARATRVHTTCGSVAADRRSEARLSRSACRSARR